MRRVALGLALAAVGVRAAAHDQWLVPPPAAEVEVEVGQPVEVEVSVGTDIPTSVVSLDPAHPHDATRTT